MYPISRVKIILSKLIIVVSVTFINILISNILVTSLLAVAYKIFNIEPWAVALNNIVNNSPIMLLEAVLASFTAIIPLFFGMKKKSASATIVSSIFVCAIMYSSNGAITIQSILPIAILIAVVGLLVGVGVLSKVNKDDIV